MPNERCPKGHEFEVQRLLGHGLYHPETLYRLIRMGMFYTAHRRDEGQPIGLCHICKYARPLTDPTTPREHTYAALERADA